MGQLTLAVIKDRLVAHFLHEDVSLARFRVFGMLLFHGVFLNEWVSY
jgi:hypothetical protein